MPAYAAAFTTALARVNADRHFLDDVIAGAGIALLTSWALDSLHGTEPTPRRVRPWRIQFDYGAVWQDENEIEVPASVGSTFDLGTLGRWDEVLPTAGVRVSYCPDRCAEILGEIRSLEFRGGSALSNDVVFDGHRFEAGERVEARWYGAEYRIIGRREVSHRPARLSIRPGFALALQDYSVRVSGDGVHREVGGPTIAALPHVQVAAPIFRRLLAPSGRDRCTGHPVRRIRCRSCVSLALCARLGHGAELPLDAETSRVARQRPGQSGNLCLVRALVLDRAPRRVGCRPQRHHRWRAVRQATRGPCWHSAS